MKRTTTYSLALCLTLIFSLPGLRGHAQKRGTIAHTAYAHFNAAVDSAVGAKHITAFLQFGSYTDSIRYVGIDFGDGAGYHSIKPVANHGTGYRTHYYTTLGN